MDASIYLQQKLVKYAPRNLDDELLAIGTLRNNLRAWASSCYLDILDSGSRAKGTAISLASDVDYLISLSSSCHENSGGLKAIFDSLEAHLKARYNPVRTQNVSFRIKVGSLEVDITPARKQAGYAHDHWIHLSKLNTWRQTNIQRHISDISTSGRTNEIKVIKIWRQLHSTEFPSIYLEYLVLSVLSGKSKDSSALADNVWYFFNQIAKSTSNPLNNRIVDPASSTNILSDLLTDAEKKIIIQKAVTVTQAKSWNEFIY